MKEPKLTYHLDEQITPVMKEEIMKWVEFNKQNKMKSPLKKIFTKGEDVEVEIIVTVKKAVKGYDGTFILQYDGKELEYKREGFEILSDLINHAFDNFSQRVLAK